MSDQMSTDLQTTFEERVKQAARGIQDNIDAWGRGEANASVEDQARAALIAARVSELLVEVEGASRLHAQDVAIENRLRAKIGRLQAKSKRLRVDLTHTQVSLNCAEREREQSRSERRAAVDMLSESRTECTALTATVARIETVHANYFNMDGEPGLDDTTPEPEDVWRYDRDLRAALLYSPEVDRG